MKNQRISDYKVKKIIKCFCQDIPASKTAGILEINRNTINRYYNLFREATHHCCDQCSNNYEDLCPSLMITPQPSQHSMLDEESLLSAHSNRQFHSLIRTASIFSEGLLLFGKIMCSGCIAFCRTGRDYMHNRLLATAPNLMASIIKLALCKLHDTESCRVYFADTLEALWHRIDQSETISMLLRGKKGARKKDN